MVRGPNTVPTCEGIETGEGGSHLDANSRPNTVPTCEGIETLNGLLEELVNLESEYSAHL